MIECRRLNEMKGDKMNGFYVMCMMEDEDNMIAVHERPYSGIVHEKYYDAEVEESKAADNLYVIDTWIEKVGEEDKEVFCGDWKGVFEDD